MLCPYYIAREGQNMIICRGVTDNSVTMSHHAIGWDTAVCDTPHWADCPIARAAAAAEAAGKRGVKV